MSVGSASVDARIADRNTVAGDFPGGAPVGVVLVHGIGDQHEGASLDKFVRGVRLAVPGTTVERPESRVARLCLRGKDVRVYEAWWADELSPDHVRGTFDVRLLNVLAWFPWLNLRHHCYTGRRPVGRVVLWTLLLAPTAILVDIVWFLASATTRGRTVRIGDQVLADVHNYLASAAYALSPSSPVHDAAERIQRRFAATLERAAREGCGRVVVVAHSLGTVIAYHGLTGAAAAARNAMATDEARSRVSHLVTIGSPLAKVRFIWPRLVADRRSVPVESGRWHNMRDRLDPVSGRLRHHETWGPVEDHPLVGRAGLVTAHTAYERNPAFVRLLLRLVGVEQDSVAPTPLIVRARLLAGTLLLTALPVGLLVVVVAVTTALTVVATVLLATVMAVGSALDQATTMPGAGVSFAAQFRFTLALVVAALVLAPVGWGRLVAGFQHNSHRHGRWLDPASFDQVPRGPQAPFVRAVVRAIAWFDTTLASRILTWTAVLAAWPLGVGAWYAFGGSFPWGRAGWVVAIAVVGGAVSGFVVEFFAIMMLAFVGMVVQSTYLAWREYRHWVRVTASRD